MIQLLLSLIFHKLWLADKLMEMNPYKPKLSQVEIPISVNDSQ